MAKQFINMNDPKTVVNTSNDGVIVPHSYESFSTVLDVSGLPAGTEVVEAGHLIVKNATGYAAQKVVGDTYAALVEGETYAGVLRASILATKPMAAVTTRGTLNIGAAKYKPLADFSDSEISKFIRLTQDV